MYTWLVPVLCCHFITASFCRVFFSLSLFSLVSYRVSSLVRGCALSFFLISVLRGVFSCNGTVVAKLFAQVPSSPAQRAVAAVADHARAAFTVVCRDGSTQRWFVDPLCISSYFFYFSFFCVFVCVAFVSCKVWTFLR